jgi:DNA-3-methyladenine glycosylase II
MQVIRNDEDVRDGLAALLAIDPRLRPIASAAGPLPLRLIEPGFAGLAHIVVSQMVSRASAQAIWGRICASGAPPTAEAYVALDPDAWRGFGLSRGKADTLSRVALSVVEGRLDLAGLSLRPPGEALQNLIAIKGIGPWTAEVYLMFCCGHADVFPAGDVALQAAYAMAFEREERPQAKALAAEAALWAPWRSIAARLFWAYYAARLRRESLPVG